MIRMEDLYNKFLLAAEGKKKLYGELNCNEESWGTGFSVEHKDWQHSRHFFNLATAIREYNAA